MMARTQVTLDPEEHRKARRRAAELGVSLAEYVRRLVARDLAGPQPAVPPEAVFDLGSSGVSDVARHKDEYVGAAVASGRRQARRRQRRG
ncbi:MAG: hypothetical protein HYY06_15980 [Deltaproteobacteria bacterium]|nr:hypothetical protein [Deltaproteobacteria bacterium]